MSNNIKILAIESSCDETAAAVVVNGREVLSNIIASQIPVHREYGGVVPEIASRRHLEAINLVVEQALEDAGVEFAELDAIAVTYGPGLVGALLVGVSYAKALAFALNKPLIAVNHWHGHIAAIRIEHQLPSRYLALVVSGSHSGLLIDGESQQFLGSSRDDAAGEAFDKIARALGLPYPGGPEIEKAAARGNRDYYHFPRAFLEEKSYDFSFSGLKSSVLNYLNRRRMQGDAPCTDEIDHIAAASQEAIVDVLAAKALAAALQYQLNTIAVVGGVAANNRLFDILSERTAANNISVIRPSSIYCTDNAAMIGVAAYDKWLSKDFADFTLNASPRLPLVY